LSIDRSRFEKTTMAQRHCRASAANDDGRNHLSNDCDSGERASVEIRAVSLSEKINRDEAAEQKQQADQKSRELPRRARVLIDTIA
jgi:hypothetical protein